ncbi:Uncharacterized protein TCM_033741 [Theobroma cacao]|uniref:SWIM-type domain-containing protein n=1 Tax=Theobroma cacao TaxID=3641 RepID=A0A061FIM8_THECC|nr:Uncharacterized protein TCM_033741 [Theobroma cacao]
MNQLKQIYARTHSNLMRIGLEIWACAQSQVRQHQLMTSNIAEYVNSCLKHARQMPITILIEFIRDMFQRWFHDRYKEAIQFEVKDQKMDGLVNLSRKTCSCYEFQTDLLPCSHAVTAISKCKCEAIEFCADDYKITFVGEGYARSIHPVGHRSDCDIPLHLKQIVVLHHLGKAKREDLGGKGFHQLVKAINHKDVHNARGQSTPPPGRRLKACSTFRETSHTCNSYPIRRTMFENVGCLVDKGNLSA